MFANWFNSLPIDNIEAFKGWLFALYVVATIGVIAGVYFEADRFSEPTKQRGRQLLLSALAAETLFGMGIFALDGRIGQIQRGEIIALETKLAPRSLSAADLAEIAAKLKRFAGQEFTVGGYDGEPASIAARVRLALEMSNWKYFVPDMQIIALPGTVGIQVWAYSGGSTRDAAKALVTVLNGKAIDAQLLPIQPQDQVNAKIEIIVGSKF